jgi:hypothetical protein
MIVAGLALVTSLATSTLHSMDGVTHTTIIAQQLTHNDLKSFEMFVQEFNIQVLNLLHLVASAVVTLTVRAASIMRTVRHTYLIECHELITCRFQILNLLQLVASAVRAVSITVTVATAITKVTLVRSWRLLS